MQLLAFYESLRSWALDVEFMGRTKNNQQQGGVCCIQTMKCSYCYHWTWSASITTNVLLNFEFVDERPIGFENSNSKALWYNVSEHPLLEMLALPVIIYSHKSCSFPRCLLWFFGNACLVSHCGWDKWMPPWKWLCLPNYSPSFSLKFF